MLRLYNQLSNNSKAIVTMTIGSILLLHTLGIFTSLLNWVLIIGSLALIATGFMQSDMYPLVMKRIEKK